MKSIINRSLSSQIGTKGIFKNAVILFYISNEGISILENAYVIGLPIPEKLNNFLKQLKSEK